MTMYIPSPENVTGFVDLGNWLNQATSVNSVLPSVFAHVTLFILWLVIFISMNRTADTQRSLAASLMVLLLIAIPMAIYSFIPATTLMVIIPMVMLSFMWVGFSHLT